MEEKVDGRGKHPNSRAALVPGGKAGARVVLTKDFVRRQVEWLSENEEEFRFMLSQLPPKEYVAAYLKLMDLVIPKKQDVTLSEGPPAEVFHVHFGAPTPEQQQALLDAQQTIDITPESEEDAIDFDNLFNLPRGDENSAHDE